MNPKLEPANSFDLKFDHSATNRGAGSSAPFNKSNDDEPEMRFEPDLPSDGRDEQGERMIRDLPERHELSDSSSTQAPTGSTA